MKILEIDIYGFGKLAQTKLKFDKEMQVFFGENEAGKSTVFSFIQAILFGFTSKGSSSTQYEPKHVHAYGGSLTLELPNKDIVKVERVKKTSGSTVKVNYTNGRIGDESDLREMLQGLDKSFFEKSYYFNLDGLREVQNLEEDEIGKYLFYTGVSGSDKLFEIEKQLSKETEGLYKKGGRNPLINGKITQFKSSNLEFKNALANQDRYNGLLENKNILRSKISVLDKNLRQNQTEQNKLKMEKQLLENSNKKKTIETRLSEIGEIQFPINGLERLKEISAELNPLEKLASEKSYEISRLKIELEKSTFNEEIIRLEDDIHKCTEMVNKAGDLTQQIQELDLKKSECSAQIEQFANDLSLNLDEETVSKLDTSIFVKDEISKLEYQLNHKSNQLEDLKIRQKIENEKSICLMAEMLELESKLLSEKEVTQLQKKLEFRNSSNELEDINRNIRMASLNFDQTGSSNLKLPLTIFSFICFFLSGVMIYFGNLETAILGSFVAVAVMVFALLSGKKVNGLTQSKDFIDELNSRKREIEMSTEGLNDRDFAEIEWKLKNNLELVDAYKRNINRKDDISTELTNLGNQISGVTVDLDGIKNDLIQIGNRLYLSEKISIGMLSEAYEKFKLWKKTIVDKRSYENQINLKKQHMNECIQFILVLSTICKMSNHIEYRDAVSEIKQLLKDQKERKLLFEKNYDLCQLAEEDLDKFKISIDFCILKIKELLWLANCEDEETFLVKGELAKEKAELLKELNPILSHLGDFEFTGLDQIEIELRLEELIAFEEKDSCERSEKQSELAKISLEISNLEESGTVEKLSQDLQENSESIRAESFKWMKLKLAHGILNKTILNLKEEKLPAVVAKAEEYLEFLTEGKYTKIVFSEASPGLYLIDQNQEEVFARDLSRGTQEMLYTALRLAFAQNLNQKMNWPLLMDDTFVNFDKKRSKKIFELLLKVSIEQQVVFFTCHEHVLQYFSKNKIKYLTETQLALTP
ncbi:MAG: family ATPase [Bacillales bacterium]|jgi:uncharacterized protein YhaN|nr:family ATPase [Bacillales bacterium]